MEQESLKGRLIFTLAIGVVAVVGAVVVLPRFGPPPPPPAVAATQTPRPSPTLPRAEALHSELVARPSDPTVRVGTTTRLSLSFQNIGTATWVRATPSEVRLGVPGDDVTFSDLGMAVAWPLPARPAAQLEPSVPPGATGTFAFEVKGVRAGVFRLPLRPVVDGVAWLDDPKLVVVITVR